MWPRNIKERNKALYLYKNYFCLIWKSQGVSFIKAIEELKPNFKTVETCSGEKNIISLFKYEFIPQKIEYQLTNFTAYDLETQISDRAKPYSVFLIRLFKLVGKYNRDITPYEKEKSKTDTFVFDGGKYVSNAIVFSLKLNDDVRKVENKIVQYTLQHDAHNGSGFDTWIILKNLPCDKPIVDSIENGKCIIELKVFNGYVGTNKK